MKMNVYADKYAQNTRKGDMEKKDRALGVCDYRGLVFIRRVRYKSLWWPEGQVVIYQVYPYILPPPHLTIGQ